MLCLTSALIITIIFIHMSAFIKIFSVIIPAHDNLISFFIIVTIAIAIAIAIDSYFMITILIIQISTSATIVTTFSAIFRDCGGFIFYYYDWCRLFYAFGDDSWG